MAHGASCLPSLLWSLARHHTTSPSTEAWTVILLIFRSPLYLGRYLIYSAKTSTGTYAVSLLHPKSSGREEKPANHSAALTRINKQKDREHSHWLVVLTAAYHSLPGNDSQYLKLLISLAGWLATYMTLPQLVRLVPFFCCLTLTTHSLTHLTETLLQKIIKEMRSHAGRYTEHYRKLATQTAGLGRQYGDRDMGSQEAKGRANEEKRERYSTSFDSS
ncbi:hypothetical protein V8F06_001787 [Rhypophila decipiens]